MRIVVIGAGAIGASVAYRLAAEGAEVVLIEANAPAAGTSSASLAWLSSFPQMSWSEDPGRAQLRPDVHGSFDKLAAEIGGNWLHWCGTLTWERFDRRHSLSSAFEACRARGVVLETLDSRQARDLAPQIAFRNDDEIIYEAKSGWVDAPMMIETLIARFLDKSGSLVVGTPVVGLPVKDSRVSGVLLADGRQIGADAVINAAGAWGCHVAALAGVAIPLDLVPGLVIFTGPGKLPAQVVSAPTWIGRPDPSGGMALHWRGEELTSIHGLNGKDPRTIVDGLARDVPGLKGLAIRRSKIGIRAVPPGGPVVGALPWLDNFYFAVSHGGIGWAPIWSALAERELLHREIVDELSGMRPERFFLAGGELSGVADDAE